MKINPGTGAALGLAAAAVMLALAGCGNPGMSRSATTGAPAITTEQPASAQPTTAATTPPASAPGSPAAAAPAQILIKGFTYQGTETVSPGAEIAVTNEDIEAHTITADTGNAFDTVVKVGTATFTAPTEPGTYSYHCIFHGNMRGTLTVK